tara:strand:+ start:1610 stop:1855 length:246 start_codon:yes stop_codon:yes gene_type:complete
MKTLLTLKEISSKYGQQALPVSTLSRLSRDQNSKFPAFKLNKKWVAYDVDVEDWLDKQKGDLDISLSVEKTASLSKEEVSL